MLNPEVLEEDELPLLLVVVFESVLVLPLVLVGWLQAPIAKSEAASRHANGAEQALLVRIFMLRFSRSSVRVCTARRYFRLRQAIRLPLPLPMIYREYRRSSRCRIRNCR
jgi:hypothetical protein